ncbi:MAG: BrnT family toxin [Acetobacteraceae bacterium]
MEFEWDEAKSRRNLAERQLPFDLAEMPFEGFVAETIDDRRDYGEKRMRAVGMVNDIVLACVYTDRGDTRRIISLRYASRRERDGYRSAQQRGDQAGPAAHS